MDNPNPIYYRDLITPDSSITDLISQLDALIQKYEAAKGKIQGAAADTAKSMSALSGATEEQRKSIALSTEASEKLLAQYRAVDNELMQTKRAQAEVNAVNREYTQIAKLLTELNSAKEGSYKQLSAQYRLNKIALNEMSEAERKGTEYGRKLEAESKAMYERMNDLQKATGKAQLQVGQYERALGGVLGVNQNLVRVLTDTGEAQKTFNGIMVAIKSPVGIAIGVIGGLTKNSLTALRSSSLSVLVFTMMALLPSTLVTCTLPSPVIFSMDGVICESISSMLKFSFNVAVVDVPPMNSRLKASAFPSFTWKIIITAIPATITSAEIMLKIFPLERKSMVFFSFATPKSFTFVAPMEIRPLISTLVTKSAVIMEITIPSARVCANPLTEPVPIIINTTEAIKVVIFPSKIAESAFLKPMSTED